MKTQRFTVTSETNATYYQMPRWLMQYAADKHLCCESVVLYTIMLDRVRMSRANRWQNENGEVYIYFKREQMMQLLNCKKDKLSRVLRELVNNNLLDLEKGGMYHASRLYLRYPDAQEYKPVVKHSENSVISQTEYPVNNTPEMDVIAMGEFDEGADFPSSDVGFTAYMMSEKPTTYNNNNTEKEQINNHQESFDMDEAILLKKFVSDSVPDEFSKACAALIGNIGKSKGKIRINRDDYEREDVLRTFSQLTAEHIKMAFNRIQKVGVRALNPKAYMQTVLYNVAQMQPDSQKEDLYAQFFGDSDHRSSPSYDLEEYEKYDLFAHKPSYDLRDIEQFNIYNARGCANSM